MSEQAAKTNASPVEDENQNKDLPVSIINTKFGFEIQRRYRLTIVKKLSIAIIGVLL